MAESQDSIDFFARYRGWVASRSISCSGYTDPKDVSAYLAAVREDVAARAFEVLGIGTKQLESYAPKFAGTARKGDYGSIPALYKSLGSAEAEAEVARAAQGRDELKPFAKACLLRSGVRHLGLQWYVGSDSKAIAGARQAQKAGTEVPFQSEGISFIAKYKDWISIKKLSIDQGTKPEEVSAHLSSIRIAADRKIPQIMGIDTASLDSYASEATGSMRRSAASLQKAAEIMRSEEAGKSIDSASPGQAVVRDAAAAYLFGRIMQNLKVDLEVSPDTLMDMFPGLKIPKPKGRMPGQKKKKQ